MTFVHMSNCSPGTQKLYAQSESYNKLELKKMSLDILSNPFAGRAEVSVDENMIRNAAPSLPDTKVQDLIRAADSEEWDRQEGVNEKFILDKRIASVASFVSAELGPFALNMYEDAQDLIGAGVLRLVNEGDRTGSFRGQNARGGSQWDIQQLTVDAFEADEVTTAEASGARVYSTGQAGAFNIAPKVATNTAGAATDGEVVTDPADDSDGQVGSEGDGSHSLNNDTQAAFILGYFSSTNPRAVEQAKLSVDDGVDRTPLDVYGHQNLGTLQAQGAPSFEYLTDDDAFDINGTATQDVATDFYPFGLNVDTASRLSGAVSFGGFGDS